MHECKICGETVKILGTHVKHVHKIKSEEYYIKYVDTSENAGKCVVCGKPTKFGSLNIGYYKACSAKCAQANPETRKKQEQTNMKKYGGKAPAMSKKVREKTIKTNRERYGVDAPYQNDAIKNKGIEVVKEKYGVENVFQLDEIKDKSRETNLEKYGVELNVLRPEIKNHIKRSKRTNKYDEFIIELKNKKITHLGNIDDYINTSNISRKFKCGYCSNEFDSKETQTCLVRCGCLRRHSKTERDIALWLNDNGINTETGIKISDGKGKLEIDIYLPEYNLGIEYGGLYWHSTRFRNRLYHKRKYDVAKSKGINLLQVFSDEWGSREDAFKSHIMRYINNVDMIDANDPSTIISRVHHINSEFVYHNSISDIAHGSYIYTKLHI
jgi:hypothetical protein